MDHLSDSVVSTLVQGRLGRAARRAVDDHVAGCPHCRILVAETVKYYEQRREPAPAMAADADPGAVVPEQISRYHITRVVGRGAMGVIYEARDPQLKRTVAIKLPRPELFEAKTSGDGGARLLREAETMARISHPNVVQVYDSGRFEGRVFIVMEMVRGRSLNDWLAEAERPWPRILGVFVDAAKGLAAAHNANVVHGDFKPDNVLMSDEGRVCVTDFGLAHATIAPLSLDGPEKEAPAISGTPSYMSPEQFRGAEVDARSDQFSFCVALYCSLYGVHPFSEKAIGRVTLFGLAKRVLSGQPRSTPPRKEIPLAVHDALLKGMTLRAEERHASMLALADVLAPFATAVPVRPSRRRRVVAAAVFAAAVAATFPIWRALLPVSGTCGNGVVEAGEECDDGNPADTDGCTRSCRRARCGDGIVRTIVEECDDGNLVDGDGCNQLCVLPCKGGDANVAWSELSPAGGTEYACYERHDSPATWDEAVRTCWTRDSVLATFAVEGEVKAVKAGLFGPDPQPIWIGMSRKGEDFVWITGIDRKFHAWDEGQPDRSAGKDCVLAVHGPIGWRTGACGERHGFVCERGMWLVDPNNNHAYQTLGEPMTWQEARISCERRGAHLVTVVDPEEQVHLSKGFARRAAFWLGGTIASGGTGISWVTGERSGFSYYESAPSAGKDAGCLALGLGGYWQILPCDERLPKLCEID